MTETRAAVVPSLVEGLYAGLAHATPYTAWRHFQQLQRNQWLPPEDLRELRWRKMKRLLDYAATQVPFYRDMWRRAGVDPHRFTHIEDLRHLPVTTRRALIEGQQQDAFFLSRRRDYEMTHSSGTTGPRVYVPYTPADMQVKYAAYLREFYATGWRLGVRSAALHYAGHPEFAGRYMGEADRDNYVSVRRFVFRALHRRILLPPYASGESGDETVVASWYDALRVHRPVLLETMDFNILALWHYIESRGLPTLRIPRMIVLASLSPALRRRLEAAFSTEIFNRFGPHEMEGVAFECEAHRGLHMAVDSVHTEFVDAGDRPVAAGELGRLVLTDLDAYVMPLIRYEIGDIGSYTTDVCPCGRTFPLMHDIACRRRDLFVSADGGRLVPSSLVTVLQDEEAVRFFQIVQLANRSIEARIVRDRVWWSDTVASALTARLAAAAPKETVRLVFVDRVPLERNGKFSFVRALAPVEEPERAHTIEPAIVD